MADVILCTAFLGKTNVPLYLLPLGSGVDPGIPVRLGKSAIVNASAGTELRFVFAMRYNRFSQRLRLNHCFQHEPLILHAFSVVGEGNHIRRESDHIGKTASSLLFPRYGSIGIHLDTGILFYGIKLNGKILRARRRRVQVRHGADSRISAMGSRLRPCFYRFLIQKTGLSKMYVNIYKARNNQLPTHVENGNVANIIFRKMKKKSSIGKQYIRFLNSFSGIQVTVLQKYLTHIPLLSCSIFRKSIAKIG